MTFGLFFVLMTNPRKVLHLHPSFLRKTLKDLQKYGDSDRFKRVCVLYMPFGVFFRADEKFEVRFASARSSLQENAEGSSDM